MSTSDNISNFDKELDEIRKAGNSQQQPQQQPVSNSISTDNQIIESSTKKRGRPKGSKNKITVDTSNPQVTPSTNSNGSNSAVSTEQTYQISASMATGFIGLISGFFSVMKLEPITQEEKQGFIEVWSNVELPFDPNNKFLKYMPLIGAGLFTIGLVLPRMQKLREQRQQESEKQKKEKEESDKRKSNPNNPSPLKEDIKQVTPDSDIKPQEIANNQTMELTQVQDKGISGRSE